jgi:non-specific serine/threonine protein kinase
VLINFNCTCPYANEYSGRCKHTAALAHHLVLNNTKLPHLTNTSALMSEPTKTNNKEAKVVALNPEPLPLIGMEIEMKRLPESWEMSQFCTKSNEAYAISFQKGLYNLTESTDGKRFEMFNLINKQQTFLEKTAKNNAFTVGCNCQSYKPTDPCHHIGALVLRIIEKYDRYYFKKFEDLTEYKNKLLLEYGFTLNSEIAKEFEFGFNYSGQMEIKAVPFGMLSKYSVQNKDWKELLKKIPMSKHKKKTKEEIVQEAEQNIRLLNKNITQKPEDPFDVGILFNLNDSAINGFRIDGLKITTLSSKENIKIVKLKSVEDLEMFNGVDTNIKNAISNLSQDALIIALKAGTSINYYSDTQPFKNLSSRETDILNDVYKEALFEMVEPLKNWNKLYYLPNGSTITKKNIIPCSFSATELDCKIVLKQTVDIIFLEIVLYLKDDETVFTQFTTHKFLVKCNNVFYIMPRSFGRLKNIIPNQRIVAPIVEKKRFIDEIVLPLSTKYAIDFGDVLQTETIENIEAQPRLYLSELNEKYLMITPKWLYGEYEVENDKEKNTQLDIDNRIVNIIRNPTAETDFITKVKQLHLNFSGQNNEYFYLHFDEVMKRNWFISMYEKLQELNVPVFGMNDLKRFNYNSNKPTMDFKTGSGTDWFDIKIEVSYGEQIVPLNALRKAIINKQQFILLGDGTLGMLPDEWIKKFSTIMRMGAIKDDALQVSKLHFTIIDQLHEDITDTNIFEELQAKKQKLKDIENIKDFKLPSNIKATLRDYQKVGYQWMTTLDQMGWGGCLADDMGLGKTLQTLSFLSYLQKVNKTETHLIVCPTSLIYNWESEINKFTPHLKYHIHYGTERELTPAVVKKNNIVITSYGTLRNDIELFIEHQFGYIILDESQAIKNHLSQTTKAVQLIKSRNRLILSGTPVQNNTFDLYSQFNFINPGIFGNMEFFKNEFANAIDRDNNKEKTEELRKMIHPFILRRTKEQVAKDLPEKTETILWCEMDKEQRKIYNSFKDYYRKEILKKIETDGFAKAGMFILSGLTKLRQICDSPAILNEEEKYPNASIKIEELMREVEENASNHKALVFSQFTTMLDLISKELEKKKIEYYYLDGSTTAANRKKVVEEFQANEDVKIFLISLKAGGVGLNLTSADYVYLVDPWWNPAVEQQAIDRTHRIGQQKNVFAYKLICKDSIEEKILQLQQKKKALSADLISDENGFVKKLTKDDVAYLFS